MKAKTLMMIRGIRMDKKLLSITIIALGIGLGLGYSVNIARINGLEIENNELRSSYDNLNATYTWLKQHSFTYYNVGDSLNISSLVIEKEDFWGRTTISGNITNISNEPIEEAYVYVILRNPDGTMYFTTYNYEEIENLYVGETAHFKITVYSCEEGQTVEIWLVY